MWGYPYFNIFSNADRINSMDADTEIGESLDTVTAPEL
jgi:hypothetical protein